MPRQWWQLDAKGDIVNPEYINTAPKTPTLLYEWAERLYGFSPEEVKKMMKAMNITSFRPASWHMYTEIIRIAAEEREANKIYPVKCPICNADTVRDKSRDGLFGVKLGWQCTENREHFMQERMNIVKKNWDSHTNTERPESSRGTEEQANSCKN